jgi:hypothetical protein
MKFVGEREVCFDPKELGFPSIQGCQAIVYVTTSGLFGFHNLGGERPDVWPALTAAFGAFVRGNVNRGAGGKMLYGVCYPYSVRGYTGDQKAQWLAELKAFASAVDYNGEIWGYDLANAQIAPSAYVNFSHVQGKCVIQARKWVDHEETKSANTDPTNHKTTTPASPIYNIKDPAKVVTSVGTTPLKTYYPEKLRG